jgi:hypothetical protein
MRGQRARPHGSPIVVRTASLATAISVVAHVAVAAWIARGSAAAVLPRTVADPPPPAASSEEITVVLLDDSQIVPAQRETQPQLHSAPHRRAEATAPQSVRAAAAAASESPAPATTAASESPAPATTAPVTHAPSLLSMRGSETPEPAPPPTIGLSGDDAGALLARSTPLAPTPHPSGELHPAGGGSFKTDLGEGWRNRTATAYVAPDGTVRFENAPDFDIHWAGLGVAGKAAFDDAIMRKFHIDPYASAKLEYLDRTRDERVAIGEAYRKSQLARSAEYMRGNLGRMWAATTDPAERRQLLFVMWDECAESGGAALVEGGRAARAYVVGFVRAHLPAGSRDAFTRDELAKLNARRQSTATFDPYGDAPD